MIDELRRQEKENAKAKARRRMRVEIDPEHYEFIPEVKPRDFYDMSIHQRVAVYVRVSTDDVRQTTSYELQQKYYEDFVQNHPNWELVGIYPDEGISGTSLAHRDEFNRMIRDCKAGKIDLILTKSVSRFARNIMICIGVVRELADLKPPVGVLFESEAIFSLNDDSQMALSFLATMAEEESHTRSRSMETSLRMRLDNGIPLTPELLGYKHDADGNLVVNPDEAPTVKLIFYMYLLKYTSQEIADVLNKHGLRSYLGNLKWTPTAVVKILRNERYCGDVLTRKSFTPNFRDHLRKKNRGERPQSRYIDHHEALIDRRDFIAVQQMIDNARYQKANNKTLLPSLYVVKRGLLRGFVRMHPRWGSFLPEDYMSAAKSVEKPPVAKNSFDLCGYEVVKTDLMRFADLPHITFANNYILVNKACLLRMRPDYCVEFLVDPIEKKVAIRAVLRSNKRGVRCSKSFSCIEPISVSAKLIVDTLFQLFDWNPDNRYRMYGTYYEQGTTVVCVFDANRPVILAKAAIEDVVECDDINEKETPLFPVRSRLQFVPVNVLSSFGNPVELYYSEMLPKEAWFLDEAGEVFETGKQMHITSMEEICAFVEKELPGYGRMVEHGK